MLVLKMTLFSRPVRGCLWQKTAPGNKTQLHSAPNFFLDQSVPKLGHHHLLQLNKSLGRISHPPLPLPQIWYNTNIF